MPKIKAARFFKNRKLKMETIIKNTALFIIAGVNLYLSIKIYNNGRGKSIIRKRKPETRLDIN